VLDRSADNVADDLGDVGHGQRLGAGWCVLGAGVGLGAHQRLGGDRGDVLGVDEGLSTAPGRHRDQAIGAREVLVAEVLHDPRGSHDGVREAGPALQVEFDRPHRELGRELLDAVGAQVRDMPDSGGPREVQEVRHLAGEIDPHHRRYEIDAVDARQRRAMGGLIVPVELDVGVATCRRPSVQSSLDQVLRDS
jgi:hypothetical protein